MQLCRQLLHCCRSCNHCYNHGCCRLCINSFGEITVQRGRTELNVRWRNGMQLGQRGTNNNKPPYKLTLTRDYTIEGQPLLLLSCRFFVHDAQ
jgi:hypothetical protein